MTLPSVLFAGEAIVTRSSEEIETRLRAVALRLADVLRRWQVRVVLAESCTAGLAAATLAQVPGISDWLCGSAVTYRDATKQAWLGVDSADLADPGAVSATVALQMASGVLRKTPEAQHAWSITGHLGPSAPAALDGVVFIGRAQRNVAPRDRPVLQVQLRSRDRVNRQLEAAQLLLAAGLDDLQNEGGAAADSGRRGLDG